MSISDLLLKPEAAASSSQGSGRSKIYQLMEAGDIECREDWTIPKN
jgi:hypothetical protein